MEKIKIEIGQRATFKNGASFIHNNKNFDVTALIGGSPYFVSIVTLKKGSEVVKSTFARLMEGLIEKRGGKLGEYIKVTTFETKKAKLDRIQKALDGGEYEIWGFKSNVASQITTDQLEEDGEADHDYYYLERSGGAGSFGQIERITATDDEMNQIIWNR